MQHVIIITTFSEGGIDVSTNKKLANLYSTAKKLNVPKSTLDGIIKKAVICIFSWIEK